MFSSIVGQSNNSSISRIHKMTRVFKIHGVARRKAARVHYYFSHQLGQWSLTMIDDFFNTRSMSWVHDYHGEIMEHSRKAFQLNLYKYRKSSESPLLIQSDLVNKVSRMKYTLGFAIVIILGVTSVFGIFGKVYVGGFEFEEEWRIEEGNGYGSSGNRAGYGAHEGYRGPLHHPGGKKHHNPKPKRSIGTLILNFLFSSKIYHKSIVASCML